MTPIDLATWPREQHFSLFKEFTQPYFNVCVQLDMGALYQHCKSQQCSFFHAYIYATLQASNAYQPMLLRIIDGVPWQLAAQRASVVELADDDTFRFSYFSQQATLNDFQIHANRVSLAAKQQPLFSTAFAQTEGQTDLIHISVLPWLNFTSFSHAHTQGNHFGIPKLVFGQFDAQKGTMPISIDVHHALMDGLHVAKFIEQLQQSIDALCA
ncbi:MULTISPECIES: CatA-like O-acetyltransferase [unclassified Pseudoalteromonas]|uniref:CatA-like O-acetyltransferase n=1 Tax=Pseudoalteromonas TaxID=53246 RepID=UPI001601BF50|nr:MULTISPECIES: CatA-like O-acetyltransferase [unclassified Pseudoalteromonas]MBB1303133.1 chloramphenicol acetyltransferase [Pseudoalteromonas sp. SR44-8]MBB1310382.1 chloramphenicol acetyltransferase [Pseudoalteromonas sp. SR41-8]MBB1410092.1 chloramphenicol acetyltransferase [Pseudoalteromonas sp. SG44-17]